MHSHSGELLETEPHAVLLCSSLHPLYRTGHDKHFLSTTGKEEMIGQTSTSEAHNKQPLGVMANHSPGGRVPWACKTVGCAEHRAPIVWSLLMLWARLKQLVLVAVEQIQKLRDCLVRPTDPLAAS